jgi:hypothetical protein
MEFLTRKEFGLPIWAWALIAAAVLYISYRFLSNRSGGSGSVTPFPVQDRPQDRQPVTQEPLGLA